MGNLLNAIYGADKGQPIFERDAKDACPGKGLAPWEYKGPRLQHFIMRRDDMSYVDLVNKIREILPYAQFEEDDDGQIIIYTDMQCNKNDLNKIEPFDLNELL